MRSLHLSLACALAIAFGLVPAAANAATSQPQAQAKALDALKVAEWSSAVVVFKLARPLAAGTVITAAGRSGGPAATVSATRTRTQRLRDAGVAVVSAPRVASVRDEPAWFFYEDQAPYQSYAHAGRVVLVGVKTGKVTVTKTLQWPPVVAGRLPSFLRSAAAYRDARYRAYDRPWTSTASAPAAPATLPAPGSPLEAAAARKQAADQLAAEHSCAVRVSDTLGDFYDAASVDQSRARIGVLFNALSRLNSGFISTRYRFATVRGGESLTSFISKLLTKRGCKDLMLYVAGGGYVSRGQSVINVGTRVRRDGRIEQQTVTASALRAILRAHPGVTFKIMLDAPYSGGFGTVLRDAPNLLVFLSSASATQGSFAALPSVVDPQGRPVPNSYNKAQLLEFSNRQLTGMYCFVDSPGEVAAGARAKADGTSKSFLAWMLARAFSLCSAGSVLATVQGAPKPVITLPGGGLGSPGVPAPAPVPVPAAPTGAGGAGVTPPPTGGPDTPTPLAPTVTLTGGSLSYTENDPATVVDAGLTAADADSTSLASATVSITGGFAAGQDVLELTGAAPAGITGSYDAATGTLALTGTASVADYQSALRAVTYRNTSDAPSAAPRSIRFVVTDTAAGTSAAVARALTVSPVNDGPTAADDDYTVAADATLTVAAGTGVLANDADLDGDTLSVDQVAGSGANVGTVVTTTGGAHATINADGSLTYDPNGQYDALGAGQSDTDTVTYRATDGGLDDTATITFTINGANDAPAAADDAYSVGQSAVLTVPAATGVLDNDDDADSDTLTVDQVAGSGANVGTVVTTTGGAHATINADGSLTYDPNGRYDDLGTGESATDTVTYRATDGGLDDTATITFTINGANDAPIAVDDAYSTDEDTVLTVNAVSGVMVNDTDPDGDTLAVDQVAGSGANVGTQVTTTGGAHVTVNADGSLSYDPNGQFNSLAVGQQTTDTLTYRTSDGGLDDTATVTITITGVNDAPTAVDDSYSAVGNTTLVVGNTVPAGRAGKALTGSVKSNDTDPDTAVGSLTITAGTSATTLGGSVAVDADGTFTYTPPTSTTNASDSFTYSVGDGTSTDTGTVTITLASRVWYVDNTAAAGGTGRSSDPFDTLAEATAAGGANATIFVHQGSGTTGQDAGAVLAANERLIGAAGDLVVGGDTLYDGTNAQRPSIGNAAGVGVTLASGSTVQGLAISAAGGAAISGGAGVAGSTIADVTLSGSSGGLSLSATSGTFTISDTAISTTGGTGLTASGAGTVNFTSAGTISVTSSGARALNISSTALSGTIDDVTVTASATGGVALQNTTGSLALGGLSLATTGGTGFLADDVAGLSVPAGATANVSDSGGTAVAIRNSTAPSATFDTVSATGAGTTGIDVSGNGGGGTTTFSGATTVSTGSATGVSLANNTGHAIAFTGNSLGITTTSGRGFDATGGGTVTVQGAANTITSTTGTPLRIANTTIGVADVTFRSISANGAPNGIVLDTTGSAGGLVVTGTGTAGSGGTIQNTAGADGTTQGIGVYLNSTSIISLKSLNLTNNAGYAIRGTTVSDFSLDASTISGTNGTNDALDEASVAFTNLLGTSSITNTAVSGGIEDNLRISNTSGTANITLDGDTIGANSASLGGNGVLLETRQTASTTTTVNDTDFTSSREDLFQSIVTDTASNDLTFSNNTLSNGQASQVSGNTGALIQSSGNSSGASLTYRVTGNTVSGNDNGIFVQKGVGIATARGRIENNIVGVAGVTGSGANNGSGIIVESRGQGTHVSRIAGNTVRQYNQDGISTVNGEDGADDNGIVNVQLTVVNNTVTEPKRPQTLTGFRNEQADPAATIDECLDLQGNVLTGAGPFGSDIRVLFDFPQNTIRLPGYAGGSADTTAVRNYLAGRNTATTTVSTHPGSGPGYVNGGAGCIQPPA